MPSRLRPKGVELTEIFNEGCKCMIIEHRLSMHCYSRPHNQKLNYMFNVYAP